MNQTLSAPGNRISTRGALFRRAAGFINRKCTDNRLIISAFSFVLGSESPVQSGAGGSRTPVQTCRKYAFYKFSLRLVVGACLVRDTPCRRLSSKVSPRRRSYTSAISPFMTLRAGRWAEKLPGERPRLRTLSARRDPQQLSSECV